MTAIQTEIPKVSRIIHHLRRRARSRICTLIPASPEAAKAGCSFKDLPPSGCSLCQQISDTTLPASPLPEIRDEILLPSNLNSPLSYTYGQSAFSPLRCPGTELRPKGNSFPIFFSVLHFRGLVRRGEAPRHLFQHALDVDKVTVVGLPVPRPCRTGKIGHLNGGSAGEFWGRTPAHHGVFWPPRVTSVEAP